jgi:hypothetical protein
VRIGQEVIESNSVVQGIQGLLTLHRKYDLPLSGIQNQNLDVKKCRKMYQTA